MLTVPAHLGTSPALVTKSAQTYSLPGDARPWFVIALVFFVFATGFALATNAILNYDEVTADGLQELLLRDWWERAADEGSRLSTEARVGIIVSARHTNSRKAGALIVAMLIEGAAIAALAVAVAIVIVRAPTA